MKLTLQNHPFQYEMENICRLFFPQEKMERCDRWQEGAEPQCLTALETRDGRVALTAKARAFGEEREHTLFLKLPCEHQTNECERLLGTALYLAWSEVCELKPKWGILTGVRPTKLLHTLVDTMGQEPARRYFTEQLLVAPEKTELCMQTVLAQQAVEAQNTPDSYSLYVSIPFCPTRCSYCSFVSHSIEHAKKLLPEYTERLCEELAAAAQHAGRHGLKLKSIYFGGGTPTTLSAEQLERVTGCIEQHFDLSHLLEYTVEAGRPDTVTAQKLAVLKRAGVGRISINPQTMRDDVLQAIGRRHTAAQTREAFALAREKGFDNINMDLITGLPGDTLEGFSQTLDEVLALNPENVTVHTLAIKRSSTLVYTGRAQYSAKGEEAAEMVGLSGKRLSGAGYLPYYLYRQSKMVGNLENVGWAKHGYEGLYNIFMMNELHTVLAVGAGAVTKLVEPGGDNIERIFNFKYPYEYLGRFDEILRRKEKIDEYYECYGSSGNWQY